MFLISVFSYRESLSQCSVCKISAESNINSKENKVGRGLNNGILYLMAVPYMMGGVAFYLWYKQRKKLTDSTF